MTKKGQWFFLGLVGALAGVAIKLLRGRRAEEWEAGRWEEFVPPSGGWTEPSEKEESTEGT